MLPATALLIVANSAGKLQVEIVTGAFVVPAVAVPKEVVFVQLQGGAAQVTFIVKLPVFELKPVTKTR